MGDYVSSRRSRSTAGDGGTIRIFISSPGDVIDERDRARDVIESLRRRYSRAFFLKPVLWEDLALQPDMSFQQGIDLVLSAEQGIDIAVFVVWSRLGTPLGALIRKEDGSEYQSGTEREFDLIRQAREKTGRQRPRWLLYVRKDQSSFDERLRGRSTSEQAEMVGQKDRVERFIQEEFYDEDTGDNVGAFLSYDRPITFSQRLRTHLVALLDELAGGEITEAVWDIDRQGPPFMGLDPFQSEQADVFFGRETDTLEARHALRAQAQNGCAFLLLSGASGSGKSSLALAGVLPTIVENELDAVITTWRTVVARPRQLGKDPLAGMVARLAADDVLPELRGEDGSLDPLIRGLRKNPQDTIDLRVKDAFALGRPASQGRCPHFAGAGSARGNLRRRIWESRVPGKSSCWRWRRSPSAG